MAWVVQSVNESSTGTFSIPWSRDGCTDIGTRLLIGLWATTKPNLPTLQYKMFNESIMEQIETITKEEATTQISKMNGD